ncbi:heterogeneous nuclear ribonucleoprotein L-like [Amphibalanus amphitrite]|uniref:heterogeneous nuclear ribonucleoprotein L-like n=1 Tax=Amphibalanus amphitrite TaxID=1232801 RepID=UPI001C9112E0|nr:heterogeneous nuclear ribonucleoprotein L-like [Amphibalanus amphitrite]XP_043215732.1 heterogeneous nuclear ribonucleoprotein L-like [Amphibalanus amphitrite]
MNGMQMEGYGGKRHRSDEMGSHGDSMHGGHGPPRKRKDFEPMPPNHILLFTVMNPVYPITVDILHTICSPHARVIRIVIFQKNGVQAMIEFESVEAACAVREALNGADIYSGCCTLKIEFAKPERLNVSRNDQRSWDYTVPGPGQEMDVPPVKKAPLLPEPPAAFGGGGGGGGYVPEPRGLPPAEPMRGSRMAAPLSDRGGYGGGADRGYGGVSDRYMGGGGGGGSDYGGRGGGSDYGGRGGGSDYGGRGGGGGYGGPVQDYGGRMGDRRGGRDDRVAGGMGMGGGGGGGGPQQGAVLMVYDMDKDRMNPDRLFNIFCQYGNVVRIKFLKTKEGCAMIQLEDAIAVERALANLNSVEFFGCRMQLSYSKQPYLNEVQQPHTLPDGTSSYGDYSRNRNNRFLDPAKASKNRIQGPSRILHFYNMPPGMSNDEINELFTSHELAPPESIKMFPARSERSCSGLMEFSSVAEAVEGLAVINHLPVPHSNSKFPYTLKLCFSSTRGGGGGPREGRGGRGDDRDDRGRGGDDGDQYY